jgi:hypothetical protein
MNQWRWLIIVNFFIYNKLENKYLPINVKDIQWKKLISVKLRYEEGYPVNLENELCKQDIQHYIVLKSIGKNSKDVFLKYE